MIEHSGKEYQKLALHIHTTRSCTALPFGESFVRVEITDTCGRMAWSDPIRL